MEVARDSSLAAKRSRAAPALILLFLILLCFSEVQVFRREGRGCLRKEVTLGRVDGEAAPRQRGDRPEQVVVLVGEGVVLVQRVVGHAHHDDGETGLPAGPIVAGGEDQGRLGVALVQPLDDVVAEDGELIDDPVVVGAEDDDDLTDAEVARGELRCAEGFGTAEGLVHEGTPKGADPIG